MAAGIGSALGTTAVGQLEGKRQRRFAKWQMRNKHQLEMEDLKKAGLNPLLTGGPGGGSPPSGGQAAPAKAIEGAVSSAVQYKAVKQQSRLIDSQIQTQVSQSNLNNANSAKAMIEAKAINNQIGKTSAETTAIKTKLPQELSKLKSEISNLKAQGKLTASQNVKAQKEIQNLNEVIRFNRQKANIAGVAETITPKQKQLKQVLQDFKLLLRNPQKGKFDQYLRQIKAKIRLLKATRKKTDKEYLKKRKQYHQNNQ